MLNNISLLIFDLDFTIIDSSHAILESVNDSLREGVGVKTMGITTGTCSKIELEKCGADYVIDNLIQLFDILN